MKRKEGVWKDRRVKVSHKFVIALAIVSILGFVSIVSDTLFDRNITTYVESLWMFVMGLGLIIEANIKRLRNIGKTGLNSNNFTHLITIIIGAIALFAGVLSFPQINIQNPSFLAIKGIISIIAIIFIIIQTWVID